MADVPDFPRRTVTVAELADALGITVFAVHYHIQRRHIPTERMGNMHVIERRIARRLVAVYEKGQPLIELSVDTDMAVRQLDRVRAQLDKLNARIAEVRAETAEQETPE